MRDFFFVAVVLGVVVAIFAMLSYGSNVLIQQHEIDECRSKGGTAVTDGHPLALSGTTVICHLP